MSHNVLGFLYEGKVVEKRLDKRNPNWLVIIDGKKRWVDSRKLVKITKQNRKLLHWKGMQCTGISSTQLERKLMETPPVSTGHQS